MLIEATRNMIIEGRAVEIGEVIDLPPALAEFLVQIQKAKKVEAKAPRAQGRRKAVAEAPEARARKE